MDRPSSLWRLSAARTARLTASKTSSDVQDASGVTTAACCSTRGFMYRVTSLRQRGLSPTRNVVAAACDARGHSLYCGIGVGEPEEEAMKVVAEACIERM